MVEVPLTRGYVALVDDEDADFVLGHSWRANPVGNTVYARNGKQGYMHRLLMPSHPEIDHKNGDGLDNRRENLRPATHRQNLQNRRADGRKGVERRGSRWRAHIRVDGRRLHLGHFATADEAARAYDAAAVTAFGEFARTNF